MILKRSNNSIFAIPANQEFVYVHRSTPEPNNIVKLLMSNRPTNAGGGSTIVQQQQRTPYAQQQQQQQQSQKTQSSVELDAKLFREFVLEHVRTALDGGGFNDNIGRTNIAPVFELAGADTWYAVYAALVEFFLTPRHRHSSSSSKIAAYYAQLKSQINLDAQFSENRCKKLLQPALALYQENLPAYYNKLQHQQRVRLLNFF